MSNSPTPAANLVNQETAESPRPVMPASTAGTVAPAAPDIQAPAAAAPAPVATSPAAPAAPPAPGTPAADAQHHGALGEIFQTLAGGKKKEWVQTDQGPVAQYRDLKPGEMARGILAAAITGLAAGYDPANRGKGAPPMSAAFSAGFKGNEERQEKEAGKAQSEAQEQFKNAGVSQQRMLDLHKDAREQQASYERALEHTKIMAEADQRIAKNEIDAKHEAIEWNQKQELHLQNLKDLGATIMQVNGQPLTFANKDEAEKWITSSQANHSIAIRPGKFDTVYEQDPETGTWSIWQKPADRNRPQWLGVQVDKNGDPVLKDGKMQPDKDRPLYGMNGQPIVPADRMTPQEFYDRNEKTIDMRSKRLLQEATALELRDKAADYREKSEKTNAMKIARDHLAATNGDLNATDKNGNLILTGADRDALKNEMRNNHSYWGLIIDTGTKELQSMTMDDPKRAEVQQTVDEARRGLVSEMYTQAAYETSPDPIAVISDRVRQNTLNTTTGKVDVDEARKQLKQGGLPDKVIDKVADRLQKGNEHPMPTDPRLKAAIAVLDSQKESDRAAQIEAFPGTSEEKNKLADYYGIKRAAAAPAAAPTTPATVPGAGLASAAAESLQKSGIAGGGPAPASVPGATIINKVLGQ